MSTWERFLKDRRRWNKNKYWKEEGLTSDSREKTIEERTSKEDWNREIEKDAVAFLDKVVK